jgi:hypothetical protein
MRAFLAVFGRELAERRLLLLIGLLGLVPLALPFLPGMPPGASQDLRDSSALALALAVGGGLALLLGATVIAADLSAGRLGFYFSRPLAGRWIWSGKLAAALALSLAAAGLVFLPTVLIDGIRLWRWLPIDLPRPHAQVSDGAADTTFGLLWFVLLWIALVLAAVVTAHAVAVIARSRSPLLGLDLLALVAGAGLAWSAGERLLAAGAHDAFWLACTGFGCAALAALALAGAVQVSRGRTDLRRGHRMLSATLWALLLAAALGMEAYSRWVVAATPADLTAFRELVPATQGSWLLVSGPAAHRAGYSPVFLVDLESRRFLSVPRTGLLAGSVSFSADGRHAAWLTSAGRSDGPPAEVISADLTAARVVPVQGRLAFTRPAGQLALSADGSRLAAIDSGRLLAAEVATGRLLASAPLDPAMPAVPLYQGILFTDSSHVRAYLSASAEKGHEAVRIVELDLATGKLAETGRFDGSAFLPLDLSPDLRRLVVNRGPGEEVHEVVDARTGEPVPDLPRGVQRAAFSFLLDGAYAELEREPVRLGVMALAVRAAGGRELCRVGFPAPQHFRFGGQPDAGHLVYALSDSRRDWTSFLLDFRTGASRLLGQHLCPFTPWFGSPRRRADLFWRRSEVVQLDLASGRARVLLEAAPERG